MSTLVTIAAGCGTRAPRAEPASQPFPADIAHDGGAAGDEARPPGPLTPGSTIEHILSTGQSNAVGFAATPPLSMQQSYGNLMFDRGVMTAADCDDKGCKTYEKPARFAALVEGDTYSAADKLETMSSAMANEVSKLRGIVAGSTPANPLLVSVHGKSGNTYWCLRKTGCDYLSGYLKPFAEGMMQVADAKAFAAAAGVHHVVRAVTAIHGESDHDDRQFPLDRTDGTPGQIASYAEALIEWQRDYETSIRAVTGQSEPVPLLISQMANWNDTAHSEIPSRQLDAHVRAAGKVVVIGPTYQLPYAPDCIHFTNDGERQLGEYFAKAYQHVVSGGVWEPVRPKQVTAAGNVVTVRFFVPKPPLVLDTTRVSDPGSFGFEVADAAGAAVAITKVALAGPDAVTITLDAVVTTGARVRYASTARPQTCPGPQTGPRGNLRDSDASASNNGYALFNWGVQFDAAVE